MKQLTFSKITDCTHIYQDGRQERMRYGCYESINIVAENGWDVNRAIILIMPSYYVEEVTMLDGTRVVFDEPFYLIEKSEYGDNSERKAKRAWK